MTPSPYSSWRGEGEEFSIHYSLGQEPPFWFDQEDPSFQV